MCAAINDLVNEVLMIRKYDLCSAGNLDIGDPRIPFRRYVGMTRIREADKIIYIITILSMPKVEKNAANTADCPCPNCPSYNNCAREKMEALYCAGEVGKSACAYEMQGCVCGVCPVHERAGLQSLYYCIHGSADEVEK
jgi:hypothetical protein